MKTNFRQQCLTGLAMLLLFHHHAVSQVREMYEDLDLTPITSKFFYPQTFKNIPVPDPYNFQDTIDPGTAHSLFTFFDLACIDEHAYIDDFDMFREQLRTEARLENCMPLAVMDIHYHDLVEGALSSNFFTFDGTRFHDIPGQQTSPYVEKEACILWVPSETYRNEIIRFQLSNEFYITNKQTNPTSIEIDFDDGLGFREVQFETPMDIDYRTGTYDRVVRIQMEREDGSVMHSMNILKHDLAYNPCATTLFPFPNTPPWPVADASESEWLLSIPYGEQNVMANVYTLTSEDNVFDKPFIFVEGIDFGRGNNLLPIHEQYQNGTFGWCEFSSGFEDPNILDDIEYGYEMLHLLPSFLNTIRDQGYDIILVDFWDGAEKMQKNAAIVEHVINLCNAYKVGNEMLVVAGASMGGQITRYALRDMELNGLEHCTRLWVSFDSPHAGANIPAALQESIQFSSDNGYDNASDFLDYYLNTKAARQLLNYQVNHIPIERNDWYSQLDQMGYPTTCRTIAISNGLGDGTPVPSPTNYLMDYSREIFGQEILKQFLYTNNGDASQAQFGNYPFADLKLVVTAHMLNEWVGFTSLLLPQVALPLDYFDVVSRTVSLPAGQYNWDFAPGGTRGSIKSFADVFNHFLNANPITENLDILPGEYFASHCFVPATSAVGISGIDPYTNLYDYIEQYPEQKHFDRLVFALDHNERHTEVTEYNLNILLEEIFSFENSGLNSELTQSSQNSGVFNYGKEEFHLLKDLYIHDGGHLYINRNIPTHFNSSNDILQSSSIFEVYTAPCNAPHIVVDNDGSLELGDPSNSEYRAQLTLNRDSRLTIGINGTLNMYEGSSIIINEGAEMIVYPGALVFVNNGTIYIQEGGKLILKHGAEDEINDIILYGDNACITINGGQIEIEDNTTFSVLHENGNSGFIQVMPSSVSTLINGENSIFLLEGDDLEDVMLQVADGATFSNTNSIQGEMQFHNCKINLSTTGKIQTDLNMKTENVKFNSENTSANVTGSNVTLIHNTHEFKKTIFSKVKLLSNYAFSRITDCQFLGTTARFRCSSGGYLIKSSIFDQATISSMMLQNVSAVYDSHFFNSFYEQISDESLVELKVHHCDFVNLDGGLERPAVYKRGGKLSVFCTAFSSPVGIKMKDGDLNLSGSSLAGYNSFKNTKTPIVLVNASDINLYKGHNDFSGNHYHFIEGSMNINCIPIIGCDIEKDARMNYWDVYASNSLQPANNLIIPADNKFAVHTNEYGSCGGYEASQYCRIHFIDNAPVSPLDCPAQKPLEVKSGHFTSIDPMDRIDHVNHHNIQKSDFSSADSPYINTAHFEHILLDSALIFAAMQMQSYDSLGSDTYAMELFHEILFDSLDQSNQEVKRKMNWGRYNMKTALENMFSSNQLQPQNNELVFQQPVQHYVDVLNLMTSTTLTDSTYRLQFYLELDKGQFFRTLGRPLVTQQIFTHLDECQLDSLEQTVLNAWRQQTDEELSVAHQVFVEGLQLDSVDNNVDTTAYGVPMKMELSNYYFGLWIESPNDITFVSCGDDPVYRWAVESQNTFVVYPNPAHGQIRIKVPAMEEPLEISIHDLAGRCIYKTQMKTAENPNDFVIDLPKNLGSGSYFVRLANSLITEDHPIILME